MGERDKRPPATHHDLRCAQATATTEPGVIVEPGYRWRRESYAEPDWTELE
ncbi:MAG: hypothetical protein R3A10_23370 [Caldilineaceae bacterium]